MRITIFAAGSRGDIQPCLVLGLGLQQAGFDVLLAAPQNFAASIRSQGLPFHPLRGDVQQIMAGETGRQYMETGGANPLQSILAMRKMIGPVAIQMAEDALAACRTADALISLAVFAPFGRTFAEICGIPLIHVEPTPMLPAGDFPAPGWPIQKNLGRSLNLLSGHAMLRIIWQWFGQYVNEFRGRFGLRSLNGADFYQTLASTPLLGAYSPTVIPPPRGWPETANITGYWFLDHLPGWQPSSALEEFLEQGQPPVYIGFGSMAARSPEQYAEIALEALALSGRRGVLATGWGGLHVKDVPDNVVVIDAAPHDWLFPRMAAVVHHGGAGTTAEGLRAGIPTQIVPFIVDQRFWGSRVRALGAGPEPIPAKQLKAPKLAKAIRTMTANSEMKSQAEAVGQAIRAQDGVGRAVQIIQQYLGV